jgi:hypothetical protein
MVDNSTAEDEVSLAALFRMTSGTNHSKPIPDHHLRGIVAVKRGEIAEHGHPYAMLTHFSDGTAEITITPRLKETKLVELAFRHEIGHWVWLQYIPECFKKDWESDESFANAYSEIFRRGSEGSPEELGELWSINAKQKWRNLELDASNSR